MTSDNIIIIVGITGIIISILALIVYIRTEKSFHKTRTNFEQKTKKQTEEIIEICKKVHTFAELKENFSEGYLTYCNLFDLNFDLKSIQDETEITITFYFSEDITRKNLFRLSNSTNPYTEKIGSINLKFGG